MSDSSAINSLTALLREAERDVLRCETGIKKLEKKLKEARVKYITLKEALEHITKDDSEHQNLKPQDTIDLIIADAGENGITAKEILQKIEEKGAKIDGNQPMATILTALERLRIKGIVESIDGTQGKTFRRKSASAQPLKKEEET